MGCIRDARELEGANATSYCHERLVCRGLVGEIVAKNIAADESRYTRMALNVAMAVSSRRGAQYGRLS